MTVPNGSRFLLQRVRCKNGVAVGLPLTVAHNLTAHPTIACDTTCGAATPPNRVSMTFTVKDAAQPEQPGLHDHRLGGPEAGMSRRLRDVREDDSGAMLIVALIIITSVAVVTGALLTQGGTNFRATETLKGVAGTSYTGDTAAKVAVNNLRLGAKAPGWVTPASPGSGPTGSTPTTPTAPGASAPTAQRPRTAWS